MIVHHICTKVAVTSSMLTKCSEAKNLNWNYLSKRTNPLFEWKYVLDTFE